MSTQIVIHPGPGFLGISNLSTLINVRKSISYLDTPNPKIWYFFVFDWLDWLWQNMIICREYGDRPQNTWDEN